MNNEGLFLVPEMGDVVQFRWHHVTMTGRMWCKETEWGSKWWTHKVYQPHAPKLLHRYSCNHPICTKVCVRGFTTCECTHGVVAKTIGWRLPAQGSIPGCHTNLWPGAHLLVTVVAVSLWVTPDPSRFWWGHFLKYNAC
jgi:hypothetical protein